MEVLDKGTLKRLSHEGRKKEGRITKQIYLAEGYAKKEVV